MTRPLLLAPIGSLQRLLCLPQVERAREREREREIITSSNRTTRSQLSEALPPQLLRRRWAVLVTRYLGSKHIIRLSLTPLCPHSLMLPAPASYQLTKLPTPGGTIPSPLHHTWWTCAWSRNVYASGGLDTRFLSPGQAAPPRPASSAPLVRVYKLRILLAC